MIDISSHSAQGIIYGLFPPLTFIASLAIAACLTPTDPVICATVIGKFYFWVLTYHLYVQIDDLAGGKYAKDHVPEKLRNILSAESAANDGMAYPFLTLSLYLILDSSWRSAIKDWILIGCLCKFECLLTLACVHVALIDQVILGVIIGAVLGIDYLYSILVV